MGPFNQEQNQRNVIKKGFKFLKEKHRYSQKSVVNKLTTLGYESSTSALSNILKDKKAGSDSLFQNYKGIKLLVYKELGYQFENGKLIEKKENWTAFIVPENPVLSDREGFSLEEKGRLEIKEKVEFFSSAKKEVIELGVSLNTFTHNFFHLSKAEYKQHFINLLKKGINIKCYLLDPNSHTAIQYFNDRATAIGFEDEKDRPEKTKQNLRKLKKISDEFSRAKYPGSFKLFTYKHFPTNNFLIVDPLLSQGKMAVSHYLYAQPRAESPIVKFTKHDNELIFSLYWESFEQLVKDAKEVDFAKFA